MNIPDDIIGWDIENWSRAIGFWNSQVTICNRDLTCLELGSHHGGLSLWLAMNGNRVICSDLKSPEKEASEIHRRYDCSSNIAYAAVDATDIPYRDHFDLIVFKSMLGGISRNKRNDLKKKTIREIHKALKPGGHLFFAENMESSFIHHIFRRKFTGWGSEWNYLGPDEIHDLFDSFSSISYTTIGFLGAFGRNEKQRLFLGKLDRIVEKVVPKSKRYILAGVATK